MYTLQVSKNDKGESDNYLRVHLDKTMDDHIPRGTKSLSYAYEVYFDYVYGKDTISISSLLRNGKMTLKEDNPFSSAKSKSIYRFIESTGEYKKENTNTIDVKSRTKLILLSE